VTEVQDRLPAEGDNSLASIRAMIPRSCFERSNKHGYFYSARDIVIYVALLAAIAVVDQWWLLVPLELLAGLVVSGLFVLGHDAAHGALFESKKLNSRFARLLFLPSYHIYEAWVFGHNRVHHGFTTRQGMDFVWHPVTPEEYAEMSSLAKLRHKLEWSWLGSGAYYLREVWWNKMVRFDPPAKHAEAIKFDNRLIASWGVVSIGGAVALGWFMDGTVLAAIVMPIKLFVVPFLLFIGSIGWTVYVHHVSPDMKWWTSKEWNRRAAQTESTTILRVPWFLNFFYHNIFVHVPHHVDMRIPFYRLPEAADAITDALGDTVMDKKLQVSDYFATTKACKLYDFDAGEWLTYKEGQKAVSPA